jgi:hypothetical protein
MSHDALIWVLLAVGALSPFAHRASWRAGYDAGERDGRRAGELDGWRKGYAAAEYETRRKIEGEQAEAELDARWRNRDPNRDGLGDLASMIRTTTGPR